MASHSDTLRTDSVAARLAIQDFLRNNTLSESKSADSSEAGKKGEIPSMLFVYIIIFVIFTILFICFIVYVCWMKILKRRILQETRKKVRKVVVTAGTAGSKSNATDSSKKINQSPRRMRSQSRESQEELKTFVCTGPIVMQAGFHGKVKHMLDDFTSHSLREVQFDPAHNEIALIGTDVDRIVGKSTQFSDKLAPTPRHMKSASREVVTSFKESITQDEAQTAAIKTAGHLYEKKGVPPHWEEMSTARKQLNSSEEQVQNAVKRTPKGPCGTPQNGKTDLTPHLARTPTSEPRQMRVEGVGSKEGRSNRTNEKSSNRSRKVKKTINVYVHPTQDDTGDDEALMKVSSKDPILTSTPIEQKGSSSEPHHTDRLADDIS